METKSVLPQILDFLSRQPSLSADVDQMCKALKNVLLAKHIAAFGSTEKAVHFAIDLGVNLGIFSVTEEKLPFLPFKLGRSNPVDKKTPTSTLYKNIQVTLAKSKPRAKATKAKPRAKATKAKLLARACQAKAKARAKASKAKPKPRGAAKGKQGAGRQMS
ncbi:uncharacterized protein LOC108162268 isoform X1 [Drosophila miranda]|uniref:uncharacterized protein LOC108162268 isoform X1 n=1 Tax=Drosophila miranda TaxID=7229 RepID=UPI00143F66F1|nr:uncharacterized protein LOC108162268 isoform X1 [Drosophila miranda]